MKGKLEIKNFRTIKAELKRNGKWKDVLEYLKHIDMKETERFYCWNYEIEPPLCKCGNKLQFTGSLKTGYKKFCSYKCSNSDKNLIEQRNKKGQATSIFRYGSASFFETKEFKEKYKQTCLTKYGKESHNQVNDIKEKKKSSYIKKFGVDNPSKDSEIKKQKELTLLNNYGVSSPLKSDDIISKMFDTKIKNKTINTSKEEEILFENLISMFNGIERQYKSEIYPWPCDFYIPSLDLYIEYQGSWAHGKEPFDKNNIKHLELLEHWKQKSGEVNFKGKKKKYFSHAINTWTRRDVLKRETAKKNNLNWVEFFTIEQFKEWINEKK